MRKLFILVLSVAALHASAIEIDSVKRQEIVREGQNELCNLIEYNSHAADDQKKFLVVIDGNPSIDYVVEKRLENPNDPIFSQTTIDSINAELARTYAQYHVELYMIMIEHFNIVVQTPVTAYPSAADVFTNRLFDEQTNLVYLRNWHTSITNEIINNTFSSRNRDCLVFSEANYVGALVPGKTGSWRLFKTLTHYASNETYSLIDELKEYFHSRICTNPDVVNAGYEYSFRAVAHQFYESAKYNALRGAILTTLTSSEMSVIFAQFNETVDYAALTVQERIHALGVFVGWTMFDNGLSQEERYACKIIETTSKDQTYSFLDQLSQVSPLNNVASFTGGKPNQSLIVSLIDRIDDVGTGGDNYTRMMRALTVISLSEESFVSSHLPQTDQEWLDRRIYWDDWSIKPYQPIGTHDYDITLTSSGAVSITMKVVNHITIEEGAGKDETDKRTSDWKSYSPYTLNPFDLIVLTNRSDLGMLQVAGATQEQPFLAPAIFLKYCDDKAFNANTVKTTAIALSFVGAITGPTAIVSAIGAGDVALALFEGLQFVGASADITANGVASPELTETVNTFNAIVNAWGISRIVVSGVDFTAGYITDVRNSTIHPIAMADANLYCNEYNAVHDWANIDPIKQSQMKRMRDLLLEEVSAGGIVSSTQFNRTVIDALVGFESEISGLAAAHGLTLEEFMVLEGKAASQMTESELDIMNSIRDAIPHPTATTIMQKAIPKSDIAKYLDGTYTSCRGFMSTAEDAKHLTTFEDIYYGMRLDYSQTAFHLSDGSCGVIRFKAQNSSTSIIPKSVMNGGIETSSMPFTGHGFTSGNNGRLGVPEWQMSSFASLDKGELWEVYSDGREVLRATYDKNLGKFVPTP